jgi:molybdate transport system substrate-binding protein
MPSIAVLSSLALKGVLEELNSSFERSLGTPLELRFDATQAILGRLKSGERADLLILTAESMQDLEVKPVRKLGSSGVGIAVRAGAPQPDIASLEAFKRALAAAKSVAHSKVGASGIYFAELLDRLNIRLQKRIVVENGPVGLVVASGEAEIGVQQLCELAPVRGIDIVGPLPHAVQRVTHFAAGIPASAANPQGAAALLELLRSEIARAAMLRGGLQPHGPSGPARGRAA